MRFRIFMDGGEPRELPVRTDRKLRTGGRELDSITKAELHEQIRRKFESRAGAIAGVAPKLRMRRRMVSDAVPSATLARRRKTVRPQVPHGMGRGIHRLSS